MELWISLPIFEIYDTKAREPRQSGNLYHGEVASSFTLDSKYIFEGEW
jgi:hypothetical protein